ncbi:MAG TPA: hypothetical protein VN844_22555 [Pyrinomonadaceae bacterium]|nr:hypothetical protein [Pyrinomonadaceae bacterium]
MHRKVLSLILLTLFLVCGAQAQSTQTETREDDTNLETQLYLILGTNEEVGDSKLPASLDQVVKQLRSNLPFKNYRLTATLVNRVKNEGKLDLNWIGAPLASKMGSLPQATRSAFKLRQIKLARNAEGQSTVQVTGFAFSATIPVITSVAVASNNPAPPSFSFEGTSLSTDISMREGEPVVVGTLNVGPSGDAIILVLSAKRTAK